jgi:hypothetical protein
MKAKTLSTIKWTARISGTLLFLLIFPFYLGYGFPIPDATMSLVENTWLLITPLFLVGFIIGWRWEKIAGYLISIPLIIGWLIALITWEDPSIVMTMPFVPGILYLIYSYKK